MFSTSRTVSLCRGEAPPDNDDQSDGSGHGSNQAEPSDPQTCFEMGMEKNLPIFSRLPKVKNHTLLVFDTYLPMQTHAAYILQSHLFLTGRELLRETLQSMTLEAAKEHEEYYGIVEDICQHMYIMLVRRLSLRRKIYKISLDDFDGACVFGVKSSSLSNSRTPQIILLITKACKFPEYEPIERSEGVGKLFEEVLPQLEALLAAQNNADVVLPMALEIIQAQRLVEEHGEGRWLQHAGYYLDLN
ncbi:hypothetical protein FNAPI_1899 [Fusarium napiforme]|uniref:Uncharacterized protein n=1 Tax=Fusarium napiforme TaxID=42672 RepID=A0A8H5K4I3_9HYPO|nr:hypothetical protein FNAPI_1899 [Fusarium napiforme]